MISVREFTAPKFGNKPEENEDYLLFDSGKLKFAVADGASDSIFSGIWAKALVESYLNSDLSLFDDGAFIQQLVRTARDRWYEEIKWDQLKLFVKNKAINGSFSTFTALEGKNAGDVIEFKVVSVGDSCFLRNQNGSLDSFPLSRAEDFNISPKLIWSGYGSPFSRESKWRKPDFKSMSFTASAADFVLATDAVSKWIIEYYPESWDHIVDGDPMELFRDQIASKKMRNDDLTFLHISVT